MLTKRIIPCLDVKDGQVVKGIKFKNLQFAGDPVDLARFYYQEGADELVLLDITATLESRQTMLQVVEKVAQQIFIPFTVGGGVRTVDDIAQILRAGADKVAINTAAVKNPALIRKAAEKFGSQCVVVAVDAAKVQNLNLKSQNHSLKRKTDKRLKMHWKVVAKAGNEITKFDLVKWVKKAEKLGAGEILLTSMDCDGTKKGYDLALLKTVSNAVNIPIIASGGAGTKQDVLEALTTGKANAALLASLFHYGEVTVKELKKYLKKQKVAIRM